MRIKGLSTPLAPGPAGIRRNAATGGARLPARQYQSARSTMEMPGSGTTNFPPSAK